MGQVILSSRRLERKLRSKNNKKIVKEKRDHDTETDVRETK